MSRRLQLLLDEERYQRVAAEAKKKRLSVAAVIRDAIDASVGVDGGLAHKRVAWKEIQEMSADTRMYPSGWDAMDDIAWTRAERDRALP